MYNATGARAGREKSWPFVFQDLFNIPIGTTGMVFTEADLAEIKRLHQANELTLDEIGERFGIAATTVSKLARLHGWRSRSELLGRSPRSFRPVTARRQARLVRRFYDTISMMLEQMEADMRSGTLKAQDFERVGKSMAAMIGGLGKATATEPDGDETQKPISAEPDAAADVERIQREIIERFERIQNRRSAEAGSE